MESGPTLEPNWRRSDVLANGAARLGGYALKWLPAGSVGWLKGKRQEWLRRRRTRLRLAMIQEYGTFTADELIRDCSSLGVRRNAVLFVQCSYNDLLTYSGTPYELLNALRELVGPKGTLFMPAYSTNMAETPCRPFDVLQEPTYTGILAELFRREEGVVRSLHPRHSICGLGPLAAEVLVGHENCAYANGPGSPLDRLRQMPAQSLCLGLEPGFHSFMHWVTDIEPEKYPLAVHEGPFECEVRDAQGRESRHRFYRHPLGIINRDWLMGKHLGREAMRPSRVHGVSACLYSWPAFANELLALRDRGIVCLV